MVAPREKRVRRPRNPRATHYVDNARLLAAVIRYKEVGDSDARNWNYIGECICKICEKLSVSKNFIGYTFRDEMVLDGVQDCIKAVRNFDETRFSNPHTYFTTIAWYAFLSTIEKEAREAYVKHKTFQSTYSAEMAGSMMSPGQQHSYDVIAKYEAKLERRKKKAREKRGLEKFVVEEGEKT